MRAVIQRVIESQVSVDGITTGAIKKGLMVLLGVEQDDTHADLKYMVDKVTGLRIFEDENDKMNLSVKDVGGELLVVSQFTLYGDCRKGRRPGFTQAAGPEKAKALYNQFNVLCREMGLNVQEGVFQAHMLVKIYNDGPVTILLDSKKVF